MVFFVIHCCSLTSFVHSFICWGVTCWNNISWLFSSSSFFCCFAWLLCVFFATTNFDFSTFPFSFLILLIHFCIEMFTNPINSYIHFFFFYIDFLKRWFLLPCDTSHLTNILCWLLKKSIYWMFCFVVFYAGNISCFLFSLRLSTY